MIIDKLWDLWINHWQDLGLIGVGLSAVVIYTLQERAKRIDAASLIVLQIDSLQNRLRELSTYIGEGKINSVAFYEALPLIKENYWDKYKHTGGQHNLKQKEMIDALTKTVPSDLLNTDKATFEQALKQVIPQDMDFNFRVYMSYRENLEKFINRNPFTTYMPEQITQSLQKILREYSMLTVDGTEGYKMLEKQAKRRF